MGKLKDNKKLLWIFILHALLLFYSSCGVLAKLASKEEFLSIEFILLYAAEIFVLFVYAVVWQQVLKHLSLTVAFSNKSISAVWTMLWGVVIFKEQLTWTMVLGALIVIVGVFLVVTANE